LAASAEEVLQEEALIRAPFMAEAAANNLQVLTVAAKCIFTPAEARVPSRSRAIGDSATLGQYGRVGLIPQILKFQADPRRRLVHHKVDCSAEVLAEPRWEQSVARSEEMLEKGRR